jgi:hypothetical protein
MIIYQIDVQSLPFLKPENNPVVPGHEHRPEPFSVSFHLMQAKAQNIALLNGFRFIQNREEKFRFDGNIRSGPAPVAAFIKPFQPFMPDIY